MGQYDIYEFLMQNAGKWFSSKEICDRTGINIGSARRCLKKLKDRSEILSKRGKDNQVYYCVR